MAKKKPKDFISYKFKDIKLYGSTEWLAEGKKKYQTVFEKEKTSFIYCEFSFYNKLFDEYDWKTKISLKCFELKGKGKKEELCNIKLEKDIMMSENIIYIREGWGNSKEGSFWTKGSFLWEAYIEDELVGSKNFYVLDGGKMGQGYNPYFEIDSIRLFEGSSSLPKKESRVFYTQFDSVKTRYIWVSFSFRNLQSTNWHCELFFKFYNDAAQSKGKTTEIVTIKSDQKDAIIEVCSGWGADQAGTWFEDNFTVEIVFMDHLIAVVPFRVGEGFEEGISNVIQPGQGMYFGGEVPVNQQEFLEKKEEDLKACQNKLNELIGLSTIKKQTNDYINYLKYLQLREDKGIKDNQKISLHSVFTGNPGTGKTTVARMLGKIYKHLGLLSKGHVHEVDRADLVGEFIGQTAPKVKEAINDARGGVLFIDEAYSLVRSQEDNKDFGREVIEILLKEMSDGKGDLAVIVAGYPKEMATFIDSNPGMKSRFTNFFKFPDYYPEELLQIAELGLMKRSLEITNEAKDYISKKLTVAFRDRDRTFGNARYVMSLLDEAKLNLGLRIMQEPEPASLSDQVLSTIELSDLEKVFGEDSDKTLNLKVDEELLKSALFELNHLVGLDDVKEEINELVKLVRYYKEIGKDVLNKFVLHTVFVGNPGTGKTTVARIIARIFRSLGILERGHLVECDRQALVAAYTGQTAIKTAEKIDDALGGVLFIDEAYALTEGRVDDFGREAVNTLLKRMEDFKDDFIVITAGYPEKMKHFLNTNPGLKSRFDRTINFGDFSPEQLYEIALTMLKDEEMTPDASAAQHLKNYFMFLYENRDENFGNARVVRKTMQEAIKNQHLRMASIPAEKRTKRMVNKLTYADVAEFKLSMEDDETRSRIGF